MADFRVPTPEELTNLDPNDHITKDFRAELARMGRASLYFFSKYLFNRQGLNYRAHKHLCDHAQQVILTPGALGVEEDPRGSGKSNAITIPGPAWCLIQDPEECKRRGWNILGPEANIGVASYKVPYAVIFINDTQQTVEGFELFRWAYPEIIPGLTWRAEFWSIQRQRTSGYSVMALGTESGATSLHPIVLFIDDMLNEKNYDSPVEVEAACKWVEHSVDLTATENGSRLITQNEWSERGVNAEQREKNRKEPFSVFFFSRARVVCDYCEAGRLLDKFGNPLICDHPAERRPILDHWLRDPDKAYTMADVEALKRSMPRTQWFAQHENNPLALEERTWREGWLRRFVWDTDALADRRLVAKILTGVGGVSGAARTPDPERWVRVAVEDMEVTAALDPGLVAPGLVCSGRADVEGIGEMVFVLDECKTDRPTPKEQLYWLFECVLKYRASRLAFENAALQGYLYQTIAATAQQFCREREVELPWWLMRPNREARRLVGVQVDKNEGSKWTRVENTLSPLFENKIVAVHPSISGWLDEYLIFPKGRRIDRLDAFAMTVKAWRADPPLSKKQRAEMDEALVAHRVAFDEAMIGGAGYNAEFGV